MQFQKLLATSLISLLVIAGVAQIPDSTFLSRMNFRSIGPAGMSGRVTTIDVDLSEPNRILVGTASGGVWRSEDGGTTWQPIFDENPTLSIGALQINQSNPDEIWVGTGEGNPRNSHNSGKGIYKTLNGGRTWKCMGLEETRLIHRVIIDPQDPATVYVGALGSAWGPTPHRGVYKTTDSGKTWEQILFVNDSTGVADMVMDPFNNNKLIVAMWEFGRKPWHFTSGGPGSGLYMTYDGGEEWTRISSDDGLPKGDLGRIGIAIARNKPDIIYALVEAKKNGLYKSVDGGHKWKLVSTRDIGNRPFYYSEIYVDPSNENRIWNLWSYVSKSEDGGRTFRTILDYGKGVHPDHHAFWQSPDDPDYMIDGNDGGVNISRDGGRNWRFIENLPVGQFYHINIDSDYPYNVYGGMQDNGSWVGPAYVLKNGGIRNADWREVYFGDGFDIMPRRDNNRYGWTMSQGGNLAYFDKETGLNQFIRPVHPEGERLRFNWNAALAQDPFADCGIYYGSQYVHKSSDCGRTWEIISPDLTTNDSTKQLQDQSGGLTIDATFAENFTTILAIAPSMHNDSVIWVSTDDGRLHITRNGGTDWEDLSDRLPGCPEGAWMPQIEVSQHDSGEVFVVVNDYRRNNWQPYLYHTTDYGATFTRLVDDEDVEGFVCSVVQDPEEPSLIFLGTDDGLYYSIDSGENWSKWPVKSFPSVQVRDLKIHPREHDLVVGTFGRAIWVLDDIRPLRQMAAEGVEVLDTNFILMEAPDAYLSPYRSVDGVRFTADAAFRGENRGRGARIFYWNPGSDQEDKTDEKTDDAAKKNRKDKKKTRLKFHIIELASGDTLRTFTVKPQKGLNRVNWNLRRNGVRYPSRDNPEDDADLPSGRHVLPGTYRVIAVLGDKTDSTDITVHIDPRLDVSQAQLTRQDAQIAAFEKVVLEAHDAFEQLKNAKKSISTVNGAFVNSPDSIRMRLRKHGKTMQVKIDSLMLLYMMPEDAKGIQRDPRQLTSILRRADIYLGRSLGPVDANGMYAVENARRLTRTASEQVNDFIQNEWQDYVDEVGRYEFDLFKTVHQID